MKIPLRNWQIIVIIAIATLNVYTIMDGLEYHSVWGIICAIASLGALLLCITLFREMNRLNQLEQEEQLTGNGEQV
jgi:uncharacterized membrane protein YcjF (UPF0283 family)